MSFHNHNSQKLSINFSRCGAFDNGRAKTWLPYKEDKNKTLIVQENTGIPMFGNISAFWYSGPPNQPGADCAILYFGIVQYKKNLIFESCNHKACTACNLKNSLYNSNVAVLRGLCKGSHLDNIFKVKL